MNLAHQLEEAVSEPDHSSDPTVLEYAMQTIQKGKSPSAAAKSTAKKLSGTSNLFIGGSGQVSIDPKKLEAAIWERMVAQVIKWGVTGKDPSSSLISAANYYKQMPDWTPGWKPLETKYVLELRKKVVEKLGHDPFSRAAT
jgi:hypothetical protein